jgi:hypothetical protein
MATTYTWKVAALDAQPSHDGHTNVINTVHWTLSGTDGEHTASSYGSVGVTYDADAPFTEYDNLSEADVLAWVWNSVDKAETEANIDSQLAELATPSKVTLTPAW